MPHKLALPSDFLTIITPLRPDAWHNALSLAGLLEKYGDIPSSIRNGFDMGITSTIISTFTPPNHPSALAHPEAVSKYIQKELSERRYTGPFSISRLENLIGPFRSSRLGVVDKAGSPDEHRLVQDFSFPRFHALMHSINSEIDVDAFPCEWGTFSEMVLLVMDAPPGTEAATLDVDAAFRRCSIIPSQQQFFVVMWQGLCYIDHCAPFGAASSSGVFGHLADAMAAILAFRGLGPSKKWVDDFAFLRYRLVGEAKPFSYDIADIYAVAEELGWPWKPSKTRPFSSAFKYLGFLWDLEAKTVQIPDDKKVRYRDKLNLWTIGQKFSLKDAESVLGTLVHCSLAVPDGRSRLPAISRFTASFSHVTSPFALRAPNAAVLNDIAWWRDALSRPYCGSPLIRPPALSSTEIWVDASTSWGLGIVFDGEWDSWKLIPGWKSDGRDIGWAEILALEFVIRLAILRGYSNTHFRIRSDNQGVIGALDAGKSRNSQQNCVLRRIVSLMREHSLWITSLYVPSKDNLADVPSRGLPIRDMPRSTSTFTLPFCLRSFVQPSPVSYNP